MSSSFLSGVSLLPSEVLRQNNVSALSIRLLYFILQYFFCARSISEVLFSPNVFQFKPQHIKYDKLRYIGPNVSQVFGVNSLPSCLVL